MCIYIRAQGWLSVTLFILPRGDRALNKLSDVWMLSAKSRYKWSRLVKLEEYFNMKIFF